MKRIGRNKSNIGILGEDISTKWLKSKDFLILVKNFKTFHGEIDIVASKNNETYFIEVKSIDISRGTIGKIDPRDNFTYSKSLKMTKAVEYYLMRHKEISVFKTALLCVFINTLTKEAKVQYLENPILD